MDTPRYYPPEGFVYDPDSERYVNKVPAEDDNGRRVMVVTSFDDVTGKYEQKILPMESGQAYNFAVDAQTGRAVNSAVGVKTGQPAKPDSTKKTSGINRLPLIILIIVGSLLIIGIIVCIIVFSKKDSASADDTENTTISEEYNSGDYASGDVGFGEESEGMDVQEDAEKEIVLDGDLTSKYPWPDIPTVSIYNNTVDEDEIYVYALNCSDPSFEANNGCPRGSIVRFNKDGNEDSVEVLYDCSQGEAYAVSVMGDYMYYSVYNGSAYEYHRMHKETREDTLMFMEDYSFISCYDGYVCCLFTRGGRHEMLRYRTDEYGESSAEYYDVLEALGQYPDATLVIPFCIYDGRLYFSGYNSQDTFVATFDPDTQTGGLLSVTQDMAEFDEDASGTGVFAGMYSRNQGFVKNYGFGPFIIPDTTVGIGSSNCLTQHGLLANRRVVSFSGYSDGTVRGAFGKLNDRGFYEPEEDEEYNTVYSFDDMLQFPYAPYLVGTSENWMVINGGAIQTDGYYILKQISF